MNGIHINVVHIKPRIELLLWHAEIWKERGFLFFAVLITSKGKVRLKLNQGFLLRQLLPQGSVF